LGKLAERALVDAQQPLQLGGCDLVAHGESLASDASR